MKNLALVSALTILPLLACSLIEDASTASTLDLDNLAQHWVHSYEEEADASGVLLYRPVSFKTFPPSHFRKQYIFERDGTCQWFYLAPDDGHHFRPGSWRVDEQEQDVILIEEGETTNRFRVVELTRDVLRMEPIGE